MTTQKQHENNMFNLGLEKLKTQHAKALKRGRATSSPLVIPTTYRTIEAYARQIEKSLEKFRDYRYATVQTKSVEAVVKLYTSLSTDRPGNTLAQPELGHMLIACVVYKVVADWAFSKKEMGRVEIATELGNLLQVQYKALWFWDYEQTLDTESNEALVLKWIREQVTDMGASTAQRVRRAHDLYNKVISGEVVNYRRGDIPLVLPGELPTEWDSFFTEAVGTLLLDLLCVGPNEPDDPRDARPFALTRGHTRTKLVVRSGFEQMLEQMTEHMSGYLFTPLPLVEPPKNWTSQQVPGKLNTSGGYHTEQLRQQCPLVRFGPGLCMTQPSELHIALANKLGSVAWNVDQPQKEMVSWIYHNYEGSYDGISRPKPWTMDDLKSGTGAAVGIPSVAFRKKHGRELRRIEAKPEYIRDWNERQLLEEWRQNKQQLAMLYRATSKQQQLFCDFVNVEKRFTTPGPFYFAWNFDHRCRIYPIANLGHPQGAPLERHTLVFNRSEHLSDFGQRSALRAIGTAALDSKVSIKSRTDWATNHLDLIEAIGAGDKAAIDLASGYAEPLCLLSLCRAWNNRDNGWNVPVYADATNSGWQIVSTLIGSQSGMTATNICVAGDKPNDAYRATIDQVKEWLVTKQLKMDDKSRRSILDAVQSHGRKISKLFGRTAIYGSGAQTQLRDIGDYLSEVGYVLPTPAKSELVSLIRAAYVDQLGDVLSYNSTIRRMVNHHFASQTELISDWRTLKKEMGVDPSTSQRTAQRHLAKKLWKEVTCQLDIHGSIIDFRQFYVGIREFSSAFHGKPVILIKPADAIDIDKTLRAVAPGIIHHLDSCVLAEAYHNVPYDIVTIHDAAGCHPNNFNNMTQRYRFAFGKVVKSNLLADIANQWGVKGFEVADYKFNDWGKATYMMN